MKRRLLTMLHIAMLLALAVPVLSASAMEHSQAPESTTVSLLAVQDTTISAWAPGTSLNHRRNFSVRQPGVMHGLVQFDLASVPAYAVVLEARLKLYTTVRSNPNPLLLRAFPILEPWHEDVTWDDAPAASDSYVIQTTLTAAGAEIALNVTDQVQLWVDQRVPNHGIMLKAEEGKSVEYSFIDSFFHLDSAGPAYPSLEITYEPPASVEVLVEGAAIQGANGSTFGPDGNMYIASILGGELVVLDPDTGQILERRGRGQGVFAPDDVIFGPDGSLYWTDLLPGEVVRLAPDGQITRQFVAVGVNPITFSDDGRLFVSLCVAGDGLYELDPELIGPPRMIAETLGFGACALNGMDFGPDGYLYGPRSFFPGIWRVDVDTDEITLVAEQIVGSALKFDAQGQMHVATESSDLLRVEMNTWQEELIVTVPFGLDNLAFDPTGRLFVSSNDTGAVAEVLEDGSLRMVLEGGMVLPSGLAAVGRSGAAESVFQADCWLIREFSGLTGAEIDSGVSPALGVVTVAPDGPDILLTSWFANAVARWDPVTESINEYHDDFAVPLNALRFQGDLIVAELLTGSIVRANGADPALRETLAGGLMVPSGLAATDDDLWAADWATGIVWQIVDDGAVLATPVPVATDLLGPEGLAVSPEGDLLVVETWAQRLSLIDLDTGKIKTVAGELGLGVPPLDGYPPTWWFSGVAVGPSGAIYVSGDASNVIYRIQ